MWDGEKGLETGFAALPFPAAVGEDFCGVSGGGGGRSSDPLQTQRLQLLWRGISHFNQAFVPALTGPVPHTLPLRRLRGRRAGTEQ